MDEGDRRNWLRATSHWLLIVIGHRAGKWRLPREEAAERPAGLVQRAGAAGGQRIRTPCAELRPHAYANNRRRKCLIIFFSFSVRRQIDFSSNVQFSLVVWPLFLFLLFSYVFLCLKKYTNLLNILYILQIFLLSCFFKRIW